MTGGRCVHLLVRERRCPGAAWQEYLAPAASDEIDCGRAAVRSRCGRTRHRLALVRIATWNVNSITARLPRVTEWLQPTGTDVLCLQETKVAADAFPSDAFGEIGYEVAHHGQGRWNGVAVVSRVGITDVERGFPGRPWLPRRRNP